MLGAVTGDDRYSEILNEEGGKPENMCEVLDRAEARGEIRGMDKARLEGINSLIEKLKLSAQQAMDLLSIPSQEQAKYLIMRDNGKTT